MRISAVAALMILTTVFLSACAQDQKAALDDRSDTYYGRLRTEKLTTQANAVFTPQRQDSWATPAPMGEVASRDLGAPQDLKKKLATSQTANIRIVPKPTNEPMHVKAKPIVLSQKVSNKPGGAPISINKPAPQPQPQVTASAAPVAAPVAAPAPAQMAAITPAAGEWQWPVTGKVTEAFGKQANGIANEGITIEAPEGSAIHAARAGEVAFVGHNMRDYGNIVILRHADGDMTSYAHASSIIVKKGQQIASGSVLGYVGTSGRAKTPQLHFAMREGDRAIDPLHKLPQQLASN